MMNLIRNEWEKIFFRKNNYRMISLIVIISTLLNLMPVIFKSDSSATSISYGENWQAEVAQQIVDLKNENKELLAQGDNLSFENEFNLTLNLDEIDWLEYHVSQDIQPPAENNFYEAIIGTSNLNLLISIVVAIAASAVVAEEFSMGTIKLLLIRSHSRSKILTAKYITVLGLILFYYGVLYLPSIITAFLTAEMNPTSDYIFFAANGRYFHTNFSSYLMGIIISNLIYLVIIATIAFSLSTITRNTATALGTTLGFIFLGPGLAMYLASKTNLARYLLMANWNLTNYLPGGSPSMESLTLPFSLLVNSLYVFLLLGISYYLFNKKDILT